MPFGKYKCSWLYKEMKLCPCNVYRGKKKKRETEQEEKRNCLTSETGMVAEFAPAAVFLVISVLAIGIAHQQISQNLSNLAMTFGGEYDACS